MKKSIRPIVIAAGALLQTVARADEIQFTTLPQPVQTTVVRETHIPGPGGVVRVIHESNGIYAVTVRGDAGQQVVYVNDAGGYCPGTRRYYYDNGARDRTNHATDYGRNDSASTTDRDGAGFL